LRGQPGQFFACDGGSRGIQRATLTGLVIGIGLTLSLAKAREEKTRKSIALAILRTETARQLQEIWASPSLFFAIKSETLSAMAGMEPVRLRAGEKRFTIALVAEGNPLDRVLRAAPLLEHVEQRMSALAQTPTRIDLRLYKGQARAVADLITGDMDFMQISAREYLCAKMEDPDLQPLVNVLPSPAPGVLRGESAVIFTRADTNIRTLSDLRGRSFLFSTMDSTLTFWAKVCLVESGMRASDLSKYRYLDGREDLSKGAEANRPPPVAPRLGNPFSDMTPVEGVIDGIYDAGVVMERRFMQVAVREKLVALKRFQDTGYLLVARGKLPSSAARMFQQAMINLKDLQILQMFPGNPTGFQACVDQDFAHMQAKLAVEALFEQEPSREKRSASKAAKEGSAPP
jgi:ABC-type phosphate/phosphonate transport system substrate-binding protein